MPFNMGPGEILLIFLLIVILFGAKRLPELARSMGKSIKEFKHATQGLKDEFDLSKIDEQRTQPTTPPPSQNAPESQSVQQKSEAQKS